VQAEDAAAYPASIAAGHPVQTTMGATMADGISVARPGDIPFEILRTYLDDVITVSEEAMSTALIHLLERAKLLVEPAGAAAVAALVERPTQFEGPVVAVLSGGNIDALVLLDVIRHGLAAAGRFLNFRARISDRPGGLMRLLTDLAAMQVNVLSVNHDRASDTLRVRQVDVDVQVATRGPRHRDEVRARLVDLGYELV
jgi:threonine dehydratase